MAEQLIFKDLEQGAPVVVLWCEEQRDFAVEPVCDWVDDTMKSPSELKDIHLHPVGVFKTAEQAFAFVENHQKRDLSLESI